MTVSIIIPTCNRCLALTRTLESVAQLDCRPDDVEVLIVDNGSVDDTRPACASIRSRFPDRQWRYLHEPVPGLLAGRHRGALEAAGDICAYLDDDVRVSRDWLNGLEEGFQDPRVALVGGPSSPLFEASPPDWLAGFYSADALGRHCDYLSLFDGGERAKAVDPCAIAGLNFAIRREVLFNLGGFHPDTFPKPLQRFQGDGETGLSLKLQSARLTAVYHPRVAVQHEVPAARLTVEYFQERAYFLGVSDSYSQVRAGRGVASRRWSWKDSLRRIKRSVLDSDIRRRTSAAYAAGFRFHQEEVRRDPRLLDWVLRDNYWDYRLPEGWERYWTSSKAGIVINEASFGGAP